jgi:hypothetical protein
MLVVAPVPHEQFLRAVEKRHGVAHEGRSHSRHLPTVGHHSDSRRLRGVAAFYLFQHKIRVAPQIAHTGLRIDGSLQNRRVQPVGHGGEEGIHRLQKTTERRAVPCIHLVGFRDGTPQEGIHPRRRPHRRLQVRISHKNPLSIPVLRHVIRRCRSLPSATKHRIHETHERPSFICRAPAIPGRDTFRRPPRPTLRRARFNVFRKKTSPLHTRKKHALPNTASFLPGKTSTH